MTTTVQNKLIDVLNAYSTQLEELFTLLREEHNILQLRDVIALEECTQRKHGVLMQLTELQEEQRKLEQVKDQHTDDESQIRPLKEKIRGLLKATREQNDINGGIIDISKQFSQNILDIIFGKTSENKYYDAGGNNSHRSNGNTLAKI